MPEFGEFAMQSSSSVAVGRITSIREDWKTLLLTHPPYVLLSPLKRELRGHSKLTLRPTALNSRKNPPPKTVTSASIAVATCAHRSR